VDEARYQAALLEAAHAWRQTFDALETPILVLDGAGIIHRLNSAAASLAGKPYAEILDTPIATVAPGQPWELAARLVEAASTETPTYAEGRDPATSRSWVVESSRFFTNESRKEERIILVMRDVTRLADLQEAVRRNETMVAHGSLIAGVSHEVRNPLFAISATLDAFDARFGDREEYNRYSSALRSQLDRLNALMADLLEYGMPPELDRKPAQIAGVIENALQNCAQEAVAAGVELSCTIEADLPCLPIDEKRMLQVFQKLVENSIQHSPRGGRVSVAARKRGTAGEVECIVSDSGAGFRAQDLPKVFDPFFTKRRGGTGLGLSIVRKIVESHAGTIGIANGRDGGALVTIRLGA
jgi:PAS domain S-box-containing protein